jgi:anti-anti-sigma factor
MTRVRTLTSADQEFVVISVGGGFDSAAWPEFRQSWLEAIGAQASYIVDFSRTSHITTSALGMLLMLREHAGFDPARVRLVNCGPDVREVLTIACFEQLFDIADEPVRIRS